MILCVDPGLRNCGVALFNNDGTLLRAGLARNGETKERGPQAWAMMAEQVCSLAHLSTRTLLRAILEVPQVYAGAKAIGDPADLLELAGVDGAIAALLGVPCEGISPRAWKGQVDPDVMTARIESKLAPVELARISPCPASLRHNVIDAVGIGLHRFGRLGVPTIRRG